MKKPLKILKIPLCSIAAVLLVVVLVFTAVFFTRLQTIGTIEKVTDYGNGTVC